MLTATIAENIVRETMCRLNRNINIMDTEGRIIASGDRNRVGERHTGALEAIRNGGTVVIGKDDLARWTGAQPGMNMPIMFRGKAVGVIGITGKPGEIAEFAQLVRMTTELMLEQAERASRLEERNRIRESLMEALAASHADTRKIAELLRLLHIEVDPPCRAFMIRTDEGFGPGSLLLQNIEERCGAGRTLAGMFDYRRVCVIVPVRRGARGDSTLDMLRDTLARAGAAHRIGCSTDADKLEDWPAIVREAAFALQFAQTDRPIAAYAGLEPRMLLERSDDEVKRRFSRRVLNGVPDTIIGTLKVFFECGLNVRETAAALYVHKNTVIYRLRKIKRLTGYDPAKFDDAVILRMALWIAQQENGAVFVE